MGYYLSKKNRQLIDPYLKILEASDKDVVFRSSNPFALHDLLRNAFNTSHPHLKHIYRLSTSGIKSTVTCTRTDIQISLEISNVIDAPVNLYQVAQAIIENNYPIKFTNVSIEPQEVESIESLASAKNLVVSYNNPILEISYG